MIGDEILPPYSRPMITRILKGTASKDRIFSTGEDFYEKMNITPVLGKRVTRIDSLEKKVYTSGDSFSFEKVMLAAGKILDKAKLKIDKTKPKPYQIDWVDEYSFIQKGIPIIAIGAFPNYGDHTPGDDVEKINFEHLYEVTRFIHALVLELGNR